MMGFKSRRLVFGAALGALGVASCAKDPEPVKVIRPPLGVIDPNDPSVGGKRPADPNDPSSPFTDAEAAEFIQTTCGTCHEKGQAYQSFWSFEKGKFSKDSFVVDPFGYKVYQAIKLKSLGREEGSPAPMPPGKPTEQSKLASGRFLAWAKAEAPDVVLEAHANYPDASNSDLKVNFNFKCNKPATFRQYIRRVTNDAFEREPLPDELTWAGPSADVPTTKELRDLVASKFRTDANWAAEYREKTLRKFADKIASVREIREATGVSADDALDLQQEFYQLLRGKSSNTSWRDLLLSDSVMVTARTAKFYSGECAANPPPAGQWAECQMQAPRGSFFTTMGFLLSKRSSFLEENNNYGRAALMNFVIKGEVLAAATDGPAGDGQIRALPSCLKTRDTRGSLSGDNFAPYGSASIPLSGNVCQSCHISRHMASGSLLFRPFATSGLLFTPESIVATEAHVAEAIRAGQVHFIPGSTERIQVDVEFLKNLLLLDGSEQACVIGESSSEPPRVISSVKELAARIASNDRDLAKGLARHFPRSLSNLSSTTPEIQDRMINAYETNGGRLGPMIEAYFSSETYACEKREE